MTDLAAKTAIVTGAGRGFGKAIAFALADAGAAVTLTSRTQTEIQVAAEEIVRRGGRAQAVPGDVTDLESARRVCNAHHSNFGPASVLVNCAGAAEPFGPIGHVDPRKWWQTMSVNVLGPLNYMSITIPEMAKSGGGCIINVSSLGANFVGGNDSAYCVSKATLVRLSEHVAKERASEGIVVFAVHPGIAYTSLSDVVVQSPEARRWMPMFVAHLKSLKGQQSSEDALLQCGRHCVDLAGGRYDQLSGQFLSLDKAEISGHA